MIGPDEPSFLFNVSSILSNAPSASGVYAICNARMLLYVGESGDIQARLLDHVSGDIACIIRNQPTGFQYEPAPANRRVGRQKQLILQLIPNCN